TTSARKMTARGDGIDWSAIQDRVDLARVATALLGPAPGRRGERGRRLWWKCPLHADKNPSFCVEPGREWWKCFGCGEEGDGPRLAMKLTGVGFPEAVRVVAELCGVVAARKPLSEFRPPLGTPTTPTLRQPRPRPPAAPAAMSGKAASPPPERSSSLPL